MVDNKGRIHIGGKPRFARGIKGKTAVGTHRHGGWAREVILEGEIGGSRHHEPNSMDDNAVERIGGDNRVVAIG